METEIFRKMEELTLDVRRAHTKGQACAPGALLAQYIIEKVIPAIRSVPSVEDSVMCHNLAVDLWSSIESVTSEKDLEKYEAAFVAGIRDLMLQELSPHLRVSSIMEKTKEQISPVISDFHKPKYLYLSRTEEYASAFPCHIEELKNALRYVTITGYLGKWPGHGHGPEWKLLDPDLPPGKSQEFGVMVLDLEKNGTIMTVPELKALKVWPEEEERDLYDTRGSSEI